MKRPIPIIAAIVTHALMLVLIFAFAASRRHGLSVFGGALMLTFVSLHLSAMVAILRRRWWGLRLGVWVFGIYTITSGLGLLRTLSSPVGSTVVVAVALFVLFLWLFGSFRNDPDVAGYFSALEPGSSV